MLVNFVAFSLVALILIGTPAASLVMALRSKGRMWKAAGWVTFLLTIPMPVALLIEMTVLAHQGLAWRSVIKLPCALCFVFGFWLTMLQLGRLMWRGAANRQKWVRVAGRLTAIAVTIFLCTYMSLWVAFVSLMWASEDREVVVRGELMVEEQAWMDQDYYAYHGPIVRGSKRVYGSWELDREDLGEAER